jgi:hypothetical protein
MDRGGDSRRQRATASRRPLTQPSPPRGEGEFEYRPRAAIRRRPPTAYLHSLAIRITLQPKPQTRKTSALPRRPARRSTPAAGKPRAKVAITLRLDADAARRLQAIAEAENRSLTNYVETALLRDLSRREEADRVITMYVAPGVSTSIRPEDVVRAEGESDQAYAERQALTVELWSIPDNA